MNRKQQVLVEENKSEKSLVTSGAIQGSVLGPVFFLMFVADMKTEVKSKIKLFVDDAKIKSAIKNEGDVEKLQEDMDRLYLWPSFNYSDMEQMKTSRRTLYISRQTWKKSSNNIPH